MGENKDIEKFFKKKFTDLVSIQDWNTPPDDSWDNILDGLDDKPKKKRLTFYIPWMIGFMGICVAGYFFMVDQDQNLRIQDLENKIKTIKTESTNNSESSSELIQYVPTNKENISSSIINNSKKDIKDDEIEITPFKTSSTTRLTIENKSTKIKSSSLEQKITPNSKLNNKEFLIDTKSSSQKVKTQNIIIANSLNDIKSDLNKSNLIQSNILEGEVVESEFTNVVDPININGLPLMQMGLPTKERTSYIIGSDNFVSITKEKVQFIYAGIVIRNNQWIEKNAGHIDNPLEELLTDESTLSSWSYGINGSIELGSKFTLNTGILYNQRSHQSTYLLQLPFSTSTEMLDNEGELINAFQHSLPTSLGDVKTDVTLSRSATSTLANNELVDIDLSFHNNAKSLMIPLNLAYFPRAANQGIYFSAGVINEVLIGSELAGIHSESHHDKVNDKAVNVEYDSNQQNKYGLGASVGSGYVWNVGQDFILSLGANYDFALSNNYASNAYQHKLNNLSFSVSAMKSISK